MYTSFCAGSTGAMSHRGTSRRHKNQPMEAPTRDELREAAANQTTSLLHLNQRLMNNKICVKRIINMRTFEVYHEDFRRDFMLKQIQDNEDVSKWIELQTHTNIVTAFDQFVDPESGLKFVMTEMTNGGNMYQYVEKLKLDLAMDVPRSYLELIYDAGIQLATAMDFAHSNGLIHGQFDLSEVLVHNNGENLEFKITDFAPTSSMELPLSSEANYWPFAKSKKGITTRERMEVLMLKDVYSLGICLLEMMIGRYSKQKFSISLDSLPLTWAEFPESTPLIQVLVECIQIDSITSRKGKLASIRKLLINEFKKYFERQFYKMEYPFIGKKADCLNKKGCVSLFHKKSDEQGAMKCWLDALSLNDRHFDSKCNEVMYRWSTAKIGDEKMINELEEFVFQSENKGQTLKAYLKLAIGDKSEGRKLLQDYIDSVTAQAKKDRIPNTKGVKSMKLAKKMLENIDGDINNEVFTQNLSIEHEHDDVIKFVAFSPNSTGVVTVSDSVCKVWKHANGQLTHYCDIPGADQPVNPAQMPMAAVSDDCQTVIIYRGKNKLTCFDCTDANLGNKSVIDIVSQVQQGGNAGFTAEHNDSVHEMRLINEGKMLRLDYIKKDAYFFIDITLDNQSAKMRKCTKNFEDRSVYNVDQGQGVNNLTKMQTHLGNLIDDETKAKNLISFPQGNTDWNTVAVLNRSDAALKFITIYDVKRDGFFRRLAKKDPKTEAFSLASQGRQIIFIDGDNVVIRSCRIPNCPLLVDQLRPRYCVAEKKLNPAQAAENKQFYKDKLYRDLHTYHMFKVDSVKAEKSSGVTEEINVNLMVHKFEEATKRPYKIKANREFLMMEKVLLSEAVNEKSVQGKDNLAKCPLIGVLGQKRIEIYDDELSYLNSRSQIAFKEISSEPSRHFVLIAMDSIVYKYDLVTKNLLFQFKTVASQAMLLYDKDDKLLCASDKVIRLWDFWDQKEQAPELITSVESVLTIEKVFVNKNSKSQKGDKLLVVIVNKNEYALYRGRMDFVRKSNTESYDNQIITCVEFDDESTCFWLATDGGLLIKINAETGEEIGEPFRVATTVDAPITQITRFAGINSDNIFMVVLNKRDAFIYSDKKKECKKIVYGEEVAEQTYQGKEICNAQPAYNGKFFMLGIPQYRALGYFSFDYRTLKYKAVKWLTKYPFTDFITDQHLSQVMYMDESKRTLDHHVILWDFDSTGLDSKYLQKIDNMRMKNAPAEKDSDTESDDEDAEANKLLVDKINAQSSCCTIF